MSKSQKDRPRLGRGLSSLMAMSEPAEGGALDPESTSTAPPTSERSGDTKQAMPSSLSVPLDLISPNPHQPRRNFDDSSLLELAASLKSTGLIQPIVVREVAGRYQLIAGERRWRAAKLAGLNSVQIIVREVDSYTQAQMALVENIQRENLNPLDRAAAYQSLMKQLGITQVELASRLGEDRSSIANHLRLLDLAPTVQEQIAAGGITLGHAKVLASIENSAEQTRVATLCIEQGLSVRNLERLIANAAPVDKKVVSPRSTPHLQDVEKCVTRQLGMRVQLRQQGTKGKGSLIIHYASLDQFDELLQRLNVALD